MMPLMLFAAGFGTRMGALTADRPKPLIPVAGRALIDHALAMADGAGTRPIIVNLHYRGDLIRAHLAGRGDVQFSDERDAILETGGGLRHALPLLGPGPVLTLNTDAVWTGANPLTQLVAAWDPARMDALLLVLPVADAAGHGGQADFAWHTDGRIDRGGGNETHVYLGAQILKTEQLADAPERAFSLNRLWDRMIADGRAYGVVHQGGWCDVGTPAGIAVAEDLLLGARRD
jgi:N-acetyl-alpha-D-muramate 1-phosphate uridylyltransferase